jgi:hypothetical protein
MASKLVNLDAMIPRADFALDTEGGMTSHEKPQEIGIRDLQQGGLMKPVLRKPDFQRETNHWVPEQVVSLLECFVNGDLIPSVIVWKSPTFLFVIDGGHRLSVIRAWLEDDYGDGPISRNFFGDSISKEQRRAAEKTRKLIGEKVGTWNHLKAMLDNPKPDEPDIRRITAIASRAIRVQWVEGNAEKAEESFFKINTQGTALDDIEELLLRNRRKPIAIAARAVIRAGMGHRYWSKFEKPICDEIEQLAKQIHTTLFQPEVEAPIKTLDLPLGGSTGVRAALQVLIDFTLAANRDQQQLPKHLRDQEDDIDGLATKEALVRALSLAHRISGNDKGSMGLHPAIYFYGPTGRHISLMFLGVAILFSRKLINNDKVFFERFTAIRSELEKTLIAHKDLIATVIQKSISKYRVTAYADLIDKLVELLSTDTKPVSDTQIVNLAGLTGKILTGGETDPSAKFSDDIKSAVFIKNALQSALKCPICDGFLDPQKSISYDHILERAAGGSGHENNCQLTHPYCNQVVKNKTFMNRGLTENA